MTFEGVVCCSYRGNGASVLRIIPYAALHFSAYEHYRDVLVTCMAKASKTPVALYHVSPVLDLVAGSAAGATAVLVSPRSIFDLSVPSAGNCQRQHQSCSCLCQGCSCKVGLLLSGFLHACVAGWMAHILGMRKACY